MSPQVTWPRDGFNWDPAYLYATTSTTTGSGPTTGSSSTAFSVPSPTMPMPVSRTCAGAMLTVFTAPASCSDNIFGIVPPTHTPQQDVLALYDGGNCRYRNDCFPWHDRPNDGFFSPAFACPAGWNAYLTMANGRYYYNSLWQSAASDMPVTPAMFPMATMLPGETAVACCPSGYFLDLAATAARAACTTQLLPSGNMSAFMCSSSRLFQVADLQTEVVSLSWAPSSDLTLAWPRTTWTAESAYVHQIASHVQVQWQSSDITDGGPSPTFFSTLPAATGNSVPAPGQNPQRLRVGIAMGIIMALIIAICVWLFRRVRRRHRALGLPRSESQVPLYGAAPSPPSRGGPPSSDPSMEMIHLPTTTYQPGAAALVATDDPPPPYPAHERRHDNDGTTLPVYQARQSACVQRPPAAHQQTRPLSYVSDFDHDHALITDGLR